TQSWYSQRSTAAQVLTAGTAYLIALSGGSTYYVANPSLPSVTLALINLGASPIASINGTSISLGTTYYYGGSNLYLTISSPNGNTIYTINKFLLTGTMSLETIGANNPNYYVGPAALPGGTWLSQAMIQPTQLTHNPIYGGGVPTFSFSITVNSSYSFTSAQGSYGNGTFYLYFKPGDAETVKASAGPAFLPDAYSPVSISGNNSYVLPYAAAAAFPFLPSGSGGLVWGPGGYIGPSLLTSLTGLSQVIINAPPPSTTASINGLTLSLPSIGPFTLYLETTGSLTLTYGNNTLVSGDALDPPSPATPGYLMAPVSGTPPLYYLATKYGGITVITRIYVPNPPSQTGILLSEETPNGVGWTPFIYVGGNNYLYLGDVSYTPPYVFQVSGAISPGWNTIVFEEYTSNGEYYVTGWLNGASLGTASMTTTPQLFDGGYQDWLFSGKWTGLWSNNFNFNFVGFSGGVQYVAVYGGALPSSEVNAFFATGILPPTPYILYTAASLRGGTWIDLMDHSNATGYGVASSPIVPGGSLSLTVEASHITHVNFPTLPSLGVAPLINGTPSAPIYDLYPVGGGGVEAFTVSSGGSSLPIRSWEWLGSTPLALMIGGSPALSSPFLYPTQSLSSGDQVPTYLNGVNTVIIGKAGGSLTPTTLRIWSPTTSPTTFFPITINGTTFTLLNNSLIYVSMGDSMAPQAGMTYYIPLNPVIAAGGASQLDMGSGTLLYVGPPGATTLQRMMVMNSSAGLSLATFTAPITFTFVNGTTLPSASFTFNELMIGSINGFINAGGTLIEPNLAIMNKVGWVALAPHGTVNHGVLYITESEEATGFTGGTTLIGVVSGYWGPSVWINSTLASGIQQGQYSTAYISYPAHLQFSFASFLALNPATAATSSATSQLGPTMYITLGGSSASIPGSTVSVVVSTAAPPPLPISPIPLAIHMDTTTSIVVYGAIFALVILLIRKGGDLWAGIMVGGSILLILGIILGLMSFLVPGTIMGIIGMAGLMMKRPPNN
ncbi:MAG: hypothetical protein RXN93_07765, partial [Thermocladium sp.]